MEVSYTGGGVGGVGIMLFQKPWVIKNLGTRCEISPYKLLVMAFQEMSSNEYWQLSLLLFACQNLRMRACG